MHANIDFQIVDHELDLTYIYEPVVQHNLCLRYIKFCQVILEFINTSCDRNKCIKRRRCSWRSAWSSRWSAGPPSSWLPAAACSPTSGARPPPPPPPPPPTRLRPPSCAAMGVYGMTQHAWLRRTVTAHHTTSSGGSTSQVCYSHSCYRCLEWSMFVLQVHYHHRCSCCCHQG